MKTGNSHYMQLSRVLFEIPYCWMSLNAKWLFVVLNELEQRFCRDGEDAFFRSDADLAEDAQMSPATLKRAKKELLLYTDLVESWQEHFTDPDTGKKSSKHITKYRILQ